MLDVIIQLIAAFFGTLGFSMLFNVERKKLLPCSLGGVLIWIVYLSCEAIGGGILLSTAGSAAVCQIFSELLARKMKDTTTTFCIPILVPLIPGGSLYRTMDAVISKDWAAFKNYGSSTLQVTCGIAIGLSFVSGLIFMVRKLKNKYR